MLQTAIPLVYCLFRFVGCQFARKLGVVIGRAVQVAVML